MLLFFKNPKNTIYVIATEAALTEADLNKLKWLFGNAEQLNQQTLQGTFIGPRAAMITPWSTNAVEITQNMDIQGITRIEEFHEVTTPIRLSTLCSLSDTTVLLKIVLLSTFNRKQHSKSMISRRITSKKDLR